MNHWLVFASCDYSDTDPDVTQHACRAPTTAKKKAIALQRTVDDEYIRQSLLSRHFLVRHRDVYSGGKNVPHAPT